MEILYEDDYLIAVSKPAGLTSVPAPRIPEENTLMGKVQALYRDKGFRPYILHRLDAKTSGVILFGKFPRNREKLEAILQDKRTKKIYIALVKGKPKEKGVIMIPLQARTDHQKGLYAKVPAKVPAKTIYKLIKSYGDYSLVEAEIKTGRRHQIRQHFAKIGHPLINDFEYGDRNFNQNFQKRYKTHFMFLHALSLTFNHPFENRMLTIEAKIPKVFQKLLV